MENVLLGRREHWSCLPRRPFFATSATPVEKDQRAALCGELLDSQQVIPACVYSQTLSPGFRPGGPFCWSSGRVVRFPILHDLNHDVLAPWAFKRAPVVTGCVRLDADKPHIGIAELAARVRNYPPSRKYLKWSHASPSQRDFTRSCFYRFRSDRAFKKFNAPKFFVCPKADIARKSDA